MLSIVGVLGVGGYLYLRLDDEIRRHVESRFADHYRNFNVQVGSARFDPDRGIAISGFRLTPKASEGTASEPILAIGEMYLAGHIRVEQLLTNQLQIDSIVIRRAKLNVTKQLDGKWNTSELLPLPRFSEQSPRITIEDASATMIDVARPEVKPWSLNGIQLEVVPLSTPPDQAAIAKQYHVEGTANGLPARELRISGELNANNGAFDLSATVSGLDISPELIANLPLTVTNESKGLLVTGLAGITLKVMRPDGATPVAWSARFMLDRGRVTHDKLPDALTEVSVAGQADPSRLVIERMSCKCGPAKIVLAANRSGWRTNAPLAVSGRITGFVLSERLVSILPESQARIWQRFRPTGPLDADVQATFDGTSWKPVITADCRGISLTDVEKFNYVLEQTSGRIVYRAADGTKPDQLQLDLTGIGGSRPIKIDAVLTHLADPEPQGVTTGESVAADETGDVTGRRAAGYRGLPRRRGPRHPIGYVEITGSDIRLHDRLLAALPDKARGFVGDLQAEGAVDFHFRAEWTDPAQSIANTTLRIPLKDCRIQYTRFPLPLQHVQGLVKGHVGRDALWHWSLESVEARGNIETTEVRCGGAVVPHDSGIEADLTFAATNVPLDETLRNALPPGGQRAWAELNPQGNIDFTAHITQQPNELAPNIAVTLQPFRDTVAIQPRMFFYRLEQLEGTASYKQGIVEWRNVTARHDRSVYSVEAGSWRPSDDGGWQFELGNINVDRLVISRDLASALPAGLRSVLEKLQPSGSIGLYKGNVTLGMTPQSDAMFAQWDINLECQQASIRCATALKGINGGIRLLGRSDGRTAFATGELALDSILWKEMQLTNVRGPFWADANQCLIGEPACAKQNQHPRRLTADAYGGSLSTNIVLANGVNPGFNVDLHLGGANLGRFANERLRGPKDLNGTVSGMLTLSGSGASVQTLRGKGELHVVEANIYELTPLVAMLKVLRNRTPDTTAFNRCDMDFTVQGDHVRFEHLNLLGDAVSLYGKGEVDLNRQLDLVFYTLIGPADLPIPLWKTFAGHVSQQGLELKVVGTFDDPKIERKPFPAINDMLNQLQTGIQDGAATITPSTATKSAPAVR